MKYRKNRNIDEENYWQPATDMMAALLFAILLIMALLFLYIGHNIYEFEKNGEDNTASTTVGYENPTQPSTYVDKRQNGGGEDETEPQTEPPTYDDDGLRRAAVLVEVIDADTKKIIKKDGILFELYVNSSTSNGLKILSTYYPEKVEFKQYQTRSDGTFFLPEKLSENPYILRNIKAPEEYVQGKDVKFEITRTYDWNSPYIVQVPLTPVKNVIKIRCKDDKTEQEVAKCEFDVFAREDIITLDGTVRYEKDEKVDTITCNKEGFGKSKELNLGKYYLRQTSAPKYYCVKDNEIDVEITEKQTSDSSATEILCSKTTFELTLIDRYTQEPIPKATFTISNIGDVETNSQGKAIVDKLEKSSTYECTLKSLPEGYKLSIKPIFFDVDSKGRISGKATYSVSAEAYIIRLKVSIKDKLLDYYLNGDTVTLYDSNNKVVANWDCDGSAKIFDNIGVGTYKISVDNKDTKTVVSVIDNTEMNEITVHIWTTTDTLLVVAGVLIAILIIVLLVVLGKRKRKAKSEEGENS